LDLDHPAETRRRHGFQVAAPHLGERKLKDDAHEGTAHDGQQARVGRRLVHVEAGEERHHTSGEDHVEGHDEQVAGGEGR